MILQVSPSLQIKPPFMVDAMMPMTFSVLWRWFLLLTITSAFSLSIHAQQDPSKPQQSEDVIRINTELTQTDVMVFNKQGRFIENLKRDQFELEIDGKTTPITFFDTIRAGSLDEDAQLAAARGNSQPVSAGQQTGGVTPLDRGRTVLFFVDDLHIDPINITRVRQFLVEFIEKQFRQNDLAAITSASGQLGFLQQLTSEKMVLLAAVERLSARSATVRDFERPPMSEVQALAIGKFDQSVTDYFVDRMLADNPGLPRNTAISLVRKRAETLLQQAAALTTNSLQTLNTLIGSASEMPGRKLLYFISDGFLIDDQTSNVSTTLRRIGDASARAGVVIYTLDARGLSPDVMSADANDAFDPTGRLTASTGSELTATQAPLRALAADTGGRALLNTNSLMSAAKVALDETSVYYLLAWSSDMGQQPNKFRRIEVNVIGHPEYIVRVRRGFIDPDPKANTTSNSNQPNRSSQTPSSEDALLNTLQSRFPLTALPVSLFVSFANDKEIGSYLTVSMEVSSEGLEFHPAGGKQTALVDVAGIVFNDQGKPATSFKTQLTVHPPASSTAQSRPNNLAYNHQARLKPGLYQVRSAARDSKSGRSGSAIQWIIVPDLSLSKLALSTLIVGELPTGNEEKNSSADSTDRVYMSITRRFTRASKLRFLTQIYNAAKAPQGDKSPDVALQVQIQRDDQPIFTSALSKVETKGLPDLERLPYAADIPLSSFPTGKYRLSVTVIDRIAKTSATQKVSFEVE